MQANDAHAHSEHEHHAMALWKLFAVFAALIVLTVLTVAVTYIDLGNLNIFIALGIALVKALLVLMWFMHLRYDAPINSFVILTSIAFVVLFIALAMVDTTEYSGAFQPPNIALPASP